MKIVLALLAFAFAFSSCETLIAEPDAALETSGTLSVTFDKIVGSGNARQAQFAIYNETDAPFWIATYGVATESEVAMIAPQYQFEVERNGTWSREFLGWNDAGVEFIEIAPQQKFYFATYLPETSATALRAGIILRTSKDDGASTVEVWSGEAKLQ